MSLDEASFNKFAQENLKGLDTPPDPAPPPAPAADAPADPAAPAPAGDQPAPAAAEAKPADKPAETDPHHAQTQDRDDTGRFVKKSVHVDEIVKRETQIKAQSAEIEQLRKDLETANTKAAPASASTIAELEAIKEKLKAGDFPEELHALVDTINGLVTSDRATIAELKATITGFEEERTERAAKAEREEQAEMSKAINANADLVDWFKAASAPGATEADRKLWETACGYEEILSKKPEWAGRPLAEIVNKAAQLAAAEHGVELKGTKQKTSAEPAPAAAVPPKPLPTREDAPPSLSAARPSQSTEPTPAYPGENVSFTGAVKASRGMSIKDQQRILLGVT